MDVKKIPCDELMKILENPDTPEEMVNSILRVLNSRYALIEEALGMYAENP